MSFTQHILFIGTVWPEPDSSAAGSRMIQLIRLFLRQGWPVTFSTTALKGDYSADLEDLGVTCASIELNSSSFDQFVKKLNPSFVIFDRYMTEEKFGWRVAEQCPDAVRVLDTEDLHALRIARQNAWKAGRGFQIEDLFNGEISRREIASIYRCDLSLIISEYEMGILKTLFGLDESLVFYLPFLFDRVNPRPSTETPAYEERSGFVSIGNFLHEPNWNAVLWLKEEIWPIVRKKLPGAVVKIYGAYPSQKVFQLHNQKDGFLVKGRAENASEVLESSRVLLAPLRFGAGLKGKLADAMLAGTPSVTTDIGAEGIRKGNEWSGLIANSSEEFAESAAALYENEELWVESQRNGYEMLQRRFDRNHFEKDFIGRLIQIQSQLKSHRRDNFTGSMLMHHTAASSRYMSKWIEAKNRGRGSSRQIDQ